LNRRRFLKYAVASAAVVGASALGLDYLVTQNSSHPSKVISTTAAVSQSLTTSPSLLLADLELSLFADWHGDGRQQADEPAITNIPVEITGLDNDYRSILMAESGGTYWARNIPVGKQYRIIPKSDNFRYVAISNSQFTGINDCNEFVDSDEPSLHLGLIEGFLTLPAQPTTHFDIDRFYDHDPDPQKYLWWNGVAGYDKELGRGYSPNHPGVDYYMVEGTPLPSPAPGVVDSVGEDEGGKYIFVRHTNDLKTSCGHISSAVVKEGDLVARGQIIAISGKSGKNTELANYPHNHFQLIYHERYAIDPYSPEFTITQQNRGYYDASRTDPATGSFPWIPLTLSDESLIVPNYWTKKNDPQHALG